MIFSVFSRRWGHKDNYTIEKTAKGWRITNGSDGGDSGKTGKPELYKLLDHDSINYPEELPGYFRWLWDESVGWSDDQIQEQLNVLAEWVNAVEKNSPGGFFSTFK